MCNIRTQEREGGKTSSAPLKVKLDLLALSHLGNKNVDSSSHSAQLCSTAVLQLMQF